MKRIGHTYWWAVLAALGMVGTTIVGGTAECATPGGANQAPARLPNNGSSLRLVQAQTGMMSQSAPVTAAQPMSDDDTPFADESEAVAGEQVPDSGDGMWQAPPSLPSCSSDSCPSCWDNTSCCAPRCGCWYGGADYLLGKAHFSQGYAGIACTETTSGSTSTITQTAVPFPYRNQSMYRAFFGYHLSDCGGDVSFTYWNLQSTAATTMGPSTANGDTFFLGQLLNTAGVSTTAPTTAGQFLGASSGVRVNIYDIDFSKYLIYGGPGRPGDCNFCPRWDLRWLAGARIAQVNRFDNNVVTNANDGTVAATGNINANFYGAGPKIGLQIRRYIGESQRLSIYAKGSMSLLLGQYHMTRASTVFDPTATITTTNTTSIDNTSRVIPVTDIEVGTSYQLCPQFFVSAGYFVQCWWDLGYGETIAAGSSGTNFGSLDTANIMAWTGLFVRAELFF